MTVKRQKEPSGVIEIFNILTQVAVSLMYTHIKMLSAVY